MARLSTSQLVRQAPGGTLTKSANLPPGGTLTQPSVAPKQERGYLQETASNILPSAGRLVGSIASLFKPSTIKQLGKIALGATELLIPGEGPDEEAARQVGRFYKERYGGLKNIKETFKEDPVGVAADVAGVLSLGAGAVAKGGALAKVGGLSRTAEALSGTSRALGAASRVVDPLVYAGKLIKSSANVAGRTMAGMQRLGSGIVGVPESGVARLQTAPPEAIEQIANAMRNSENSLGLVDDIQKSVKALDDVVWKVGGEVAKSYPGKYSAANVAPAAIEKLKSRLGIDIVEKVDAKGLFKGYDVVDGGPFSAATVRAHIVPVLEELRKFREQNMTVTKLWDKSKMVGTELEKIQQKTGGDVVTNAFLEAVHEAMPKDFWPQIQAQGEAQRIGNAFKQAFGQGNLEGYAATPEYRAQIAETRLGQLFGKNKTATQRVVEKFESTLKAEVDKLRAMTGKSIDELVQAGILEADVAELMKSPQILNMALGRAFSAKMPSVLRSISLAGGGLGAGAAGLGIGAVPATLAGLAMFSPRLQGEIGLALGMAANRGGLGNVVRGSTPGRLIWGNMPTYKKLRMLTNSNQQQQ